MKIKSWDDVDGALAEIARRQAIIAAAKGQIDEQRKAIAEIEPRMEAFVVEHEDELQERSKALAHGRVWLRRATSLTARSWAKVLEKLEAFGLTDCIRLKPEPNKEALGMLPDDRLKELGVKRTTEDVFGYEAA